MRMGRFYALIICFIFGYAVLTGELRLSAALVDVLGIVALIILIILFWRTK